LSFGFLLASLSRPALEIAREFVPVPSNQTIYEHHRDQTRAVEAGLSKLDNIEAQIELFLSGSDIPESRDVHAARFASRESVRGLPATP
jgi:hypothetical protein